MFNVPAPYALSSNVTDMVDMFSWMNALTTPTGLFGGLILVSIFMITFILNLKKDATTAFAIASWVTMLSAIFLSMMEGAFGYLIPGNYLSVTVALAVVSVILLYMER